MNDPSILPQVEEQQEVTKDVRKTGIRWLMLFMACNFLIGSYYCYDIPGAIESSFRKQFDNMGAS